MPSSDDGDAAAAVNGVTVIGAVIASAHHHPPRTMSAGFGMIPVRTVSSGIGAVLNLKTSTGVGASPSYIVAQNDNLFPAITAAEPCRASVVGWSVTKHGEAIIFHSDISNRKRLAFTGSGTRGPYCGRRFLQ